MTEFKPGSIVVVDRDGPFPMPASPAWAPGPDRGTIPDRLPPIPQMPRELGQHVGLLLDPHPDIPPPELTEAIHAAAVAYRRALSRYLGPASPEVISAWFWPLGDAVEWFPAADEFQRRLGVLIMFSDHIPWIAWNAKTQREACTTLKRLPAVATVHELIMPCVQKLLEINGALTRIIEAKSLPPKA